jgi:hypothetical protein
MKIGDLVWIREEYVGNAFLELPKGIHTALLLRENKNVYDNYDWEALVGDRIVYLAVSEIEHFNEP